MIFNALLIMEIYFDFFTPQFFNKIKFTPFLNLHKNIIVDIHYRQATFSNLTYLELYTSLQECFDKLVIYHEIRSHLFIYVTT